jgi:hypothetical protein
LQIVAGRVNLKDQKTANSALLHDEVRILIFDDPAELEESQRPKFCFAQLDSSYLKTHKGTVLLCVDHPFSILVLVPTKFSTL